MNSKTETAQAPRSAGGSVKSGAGIYLIEHLFDHFYKLMIDLKKPSDRKSQSVVMAACNQGEGATTMALNFASALANDPSKNILLVDANLRSPLLHNYFGIERDRGLADLIQGDIDIEQAVRKTPTERLYFIPAGRTPGNPVILFESAEFLTVMEKLHAMFEFIIFDSSPLIRFSETAMLASRLDGLIMILEAESTRREVAQVARSTLERTGANLFGAILNKKRFFIPQKLYRLL
jgi:capsular exopolysaccharide synthesis family protein